MRRTTAALAGLLAGALVLSGTGAAPPVFPDLQGHWAQSPAMALSIRGILSGFPDGSFQPYALLTRAQAARVLAAVVAGPQEMERLASAPSRFPDLEGHWAAGYVEAAAERSLILGHPDGSFRPEAPLRRVEAILLAVRATGLLARAPGSPEPASLPYPDAADLPDWALPAVQAAVRAGLLQDVFSGPPLQPNRPVSRAEWAALVARILAQRGGLHHLRGTVEFWDEAGGVLRVRTDGGALQSVPVPPDALVFRSGIPRRLFRPLDQVWLILGRRGEAVYAESRYSDLTGHTVQVRGRELTLIDDAWMRRTVVLDTGARVFVNGRPAEPAALQGANRIYLVLDVNTGAARVADAVKYTHQGALTAVQGSGDPLTITLTHRSGQVAVLPVSPDVVVFNQGARTTLAALALGTPLLVAAPGGGPVTYIEVDR